MSKFAPNAVSNLTATPITINRIDLSWTLNNAGFENGVIVERTVGGQFQPLTTLGANVTSYSDTTVQPGSSYSYKVTPSAPVAPMFIPCAGVVASAQTSGLPPHK